MNVNRSKSCQQCPRKFDYSCNLTCTPNSVRLTQLRCFQVYIHSFLDFFGQYTDELLIAVRGRMAGWIRAVLAMSRQQRAIFGEGQCACAYRFVSIFYSYVRPIVWGKKKAMTEFGVNVDASIVDYNICKNKDNKTSKCFVGGCLLSSFKFSKICDNILKPKR